MKVLPEDVETLVARLAVLGIDVVGVVGETRVGHAAHRDDAVVGEPRGADVDLRGDGRRGSGTKTLLVVHVAQALALAVVGAHLERHELEVVDLVLVTETGPDVMREKAGAAEDVVGRAWQEALARAAFDGGQVVGGRELVAAERALLLPGTQEEGPLGPFLGKPDVDPRVAEPEAAPARRLADDCRRAAAGRHRRRGAGGGAQHIAAALEGRLDEDDDVLGDVALGFDAGSPGEEVGLRAEDGGVVLVVEVVELLLEPAGHLDVRIDGLCLQAAQASGEDERGPG